MERTTSIPCVSVRPGYIAAYSQPLHTRRSKQQSIGIHECPRCHKRVDQLYTIAVECFPHEQEVCAQCQRDHNLAHNDARGHVSQKAERRIKQKIDWLLYLAQPKQYRAHKSGKLHQFRINFVTLTLSASQMHDDITLKHELLNPFLNHVRRRWKCSHYLWRAEPQKNGNLHFHIVTDTFIPWSELRDTWNGLQAKLGYIDRFKDKHGHRQPNSTDVHAVVKIRNISAYLAKYCAKNKAGRSVAGRLVGWSQSLSRIKSARDERHSTIDNELQRLAEWFPDQVKRLDYVTIIYVPVAQWCKRLRGALYDLFRQYVTDYRQAFAPT